MGIVTDELNLDQYEGIMARLEEIIKRLEAGQAPLGESLRLYQEAKALSVKADQLLNRAQSAMADSATLEKAEDG